MAVASASKEKTEPSVDSFPSSPLVSKPGSDSCSETSSIGTSGVVADAFDRNDQFDSSVQQRKDAEIQSSVMFRSEEYRLLFRLPPDEVLVRDFNCAFQESILLQGHMYLFARHICFYSNIFGFETKKIIPFHEVTCVRKAKTAAIFPNAIEILAGTKKYFFASFLSRDEAYRLIVDGWSQHSAGVAALIDRQDSKSELRSQGNGDVLIDKLKNCEQIPNDFDSFDRNKDAHVSGELKKQSIDEEEIVVSTRHFELLENGEDNTVLLASAECSSSGVPLKWKVEDADAPTVPEYYKKVAESRFPVEVEEFFSLFFSDDAVGFVENFHKRCGDKDFRCTSWYEHELFGHARDVSFQHPIKLYFGAKFGHCHEVQKFRVFRNSHLVIETSQEVNDVPYADYFRVQGLWVVEKEGDEASGGCILQVYVNVAFSKKTMWKGKIEQSTLEECRDAYSTWLNIAHDSLKQENLAKPEEASVTNMIQNDDFQLEGNERMKEISERVHDSREVPASHVVSAGGQSMLDKNHVQGDMIDSSCDTHSLSGSLRNFLSYLKSRNHLSLVLVIASLSILLLMQLSIMVLLTRAPQVHIISQLDYARHVGSKGGDGRTETIAWLEKRVHNLKDEMLMVEAHLERMLHEHAMLKAQLKSLEEVRERT